MLLYYRNFYNMNSFSTDCNTLLKTFGSAYTIVMLHQNIFVPKGEYLLLGL